MNKAGEKPLNARREPKKRGRSPNGSARGMKALGVGDQPPGKKSGKKREFPFDEKLARAQRMESLGMIASGLAHDFNNFLEVIVGFASLARLRLPPQEEVQEPIRMIEEAARRAADLATQLLDLTREGGERQESCDPSDALRRILKIIRRTFDRKIRIESRIEPDLPWIRGDRQSLEQAILNLAINARDAMPEGGILSIFGSRRTIPAGELPAAGSAARRELASKSRSDGAAQGSPASGDYVQISVQDNGMGMEPGILRRIFEPFFTTKPEGEGTGLGLAMVKNAVKSSGGFIEVESKPRKGSRFVVTLPVTVTRDKAGVRKAPHVRPGRGTVLVVDDEPMVLDFVQKGLKQLGYDVLTAESGMRACELYAAHGSQIACVLLDMVMPEMSGLETFEQLRRVDPGVKIVLSSGYSRTALGEAASSADFLGKPYSIESLSLAIKKARED